MEKKLVVNVKIVKQHGANCAVVLGVVNSSEEPLSNTEVAGYLGFSFPTAQKCLQKLADDGLIRMDGKKYRKL